MADRAANNILIASTILQLERDFEDGVTRITQFSVLDDAIAVWRQSYRVK
jgi:hypothetical protein